MIAIANGSALAACVGQIDYNVLTSPSMNGAGAGADRSGFFVNSFGEPHQLRCKRLGRKWDKQQLVPSEYVEKCSRPSPYNPHYPFSLEFEVNPTGLVPNAPADAFWKTGAGGFSIYIIPSLDTVIYKTGGTTRHTMAL